ncbi:MAG: nascent polypeptide-associated complex protein [Acidilobus sp.]|jgi:nascent polypeptide-associated complex subunit alpha
MGLNPRELRRALKRMGIEAEELNAAKVSIETSDGKILEVESPQVMIIRAKGQPTMIYVVGEPREVKREVKEEARATISEDDIRLVAEQAGVDLETARRALEEAKGDIAEAILRLKGSP